MELRLQFKVNQRYQVLHERVAADIYSCFFAATGFSVMPYPWQAVPMSAFDTHSLGRAPQSRHRWHQCDGKLSLWKDEAMWKWLKSTHKEAEVEKKGANER